MPEKAEKDIQQENFEDLARRYRNGFFLLYEEGKQPTPVLLTNVDQINHGQIEVYLSDIAGKQQAKTLSQIKLVEVYPDRGLYNYKPTLPTKRYYTKHYDPVIFFSRKNKRQWAHGLRPETCWASMPFADTIDLLCGTTTGHQISGNGFDFQLVYSMFFPWYPTTWEEALKYLEVNPAVALSRDFMLIHDFTLPEGYLLAKNHRVVGSVTTKKISLEEPILAQEVIDLIARNKYNVKFEIGNG